MVYWLEPLKKVKVIHKLMKQKLGNTIQTNQNQKYD